METSGSRVLLKGRHVPTTYKQKSSEGKDGLNNDIRELYLILLNYPMLNAEC